MFSRIGFFVVFLFSLTFLRAGVIDESKSPAPEGPVFLISGSDITVDVPSFQIFPFEREVTVRFNNPDHSRLVNSNNVLEFIINGEPVKLVFANGESKFSASAKDGRISILIDNFTLSQDLITLGWWFPATLTTALGLILLFVKSKKAKH